VICGHALSVSAIKTGSPASAWNDEPGLGESSAVSAPLKTLFCLFLNISKFPLLNIAAAMLRSRRAAHSVGYALFQVAAADHK